MGPISKGEGVVVRGLGKYQEDRDGNYLKSQKYRNELIGSLS